MSDFRILAPMRVAVAQIEPKLAEKERNLDLCLARLEEAVEQGAELLVLPECAIPGYVYESGEEALPYAEEIPGPSTEALEEACRRLDALRRLRLARARRRHDPQRGGARRPGRSRSARTARATSRSSASTASSRPGDELPVFDTPIGRIGLEICYDLRFPEVTRTLALAGAEIVCLPTNWPVAAAGQRGAAQPPRARTRTGSTCSSRTGSGRSAPPSSAAAARSSTRPASGSRRPMRRARRCSSPRSTSTGRARSRSSPLPASTRCTCSDTVDPSSTAPSSRRPRASRPRRRFA